MSTKTKNPKTEYILIERRQIVLSWWIAKVKKGAKNVPQRFVESQHPFNFDPTDSQVDEDDFSVSLDPPSPEEIKEARADGEICDLTKDDR